MISTTEEKQHVLTKELLDQMRSVDGFPIGKDEDIIALSDPPYYTACPNPWIEEFIKENGKPWDPKTDSYNREPFATDVIEGKNDPIYDAHSYHTKVPHKAIMRYILHYTEPGDIVFDGFCGTGMTGVAAQRCENPDPEFRDKIDREMPGVKWGARKTILNDLSPAATFIAYNYNTPVEVSEFEREAKRIIAEVEAECGWMYETQHVIDGKTIAFHDVNGIKKSILGKINFIIWSDIFLCPNCLKEIIFWDVAVDYEQGEMKDEFNCPFCRKLISKDPKKDPNTKKTVSEKMEHAWDSYFDENLNKTVQKAKQIPVLINYTVIDNKGQKHRFEKIPDEKDFALIKKIEMSKIPYWFPTDKIPAGDKTADPFNVGIFYAHQFYTKQNLWALSKLFNLIIKKDNKRVKNLLLLLFTAILPNSSKMRRFRTDKKGGGPLTGTLYFSSIITPPNVIISFERNIENIKEAAEIFSTFRKKTSISAESSSSLLHLPANVIDYIFIDPPFGSNLQYSELNFIWEAWLKIFSNNQKEAVINKTQRKGLAEYQNIMEKCFKEFYRTLKPGRWMTVEFHNSKNSVWMAIQESLQRAGFVVADVRTLDKKQGSFNQVQSTGQSVKQDLIISAYKPNGGLEDRFKLTAGTQDGVWDFVRQHLKHLPIFVEMQDAVQIVTERQQHLLFDRMVAFHVQRGVIVPISAGDFYAGLRQRFPERDGMYFLETEVLEYDKKRMTVKRIEQASLFVHDEKSAVHWLNKELSEKPQTYQDIQPKFLQELHQDKFEKLPELAAMLEQNFLQNINGQWYVPDPNEQADLDKVRERSLLREFEEYKKTKGKLKLFRTEAVRAGFKSAWAERDYGMIIAIGERLPSQILQEDDVLLMYYDNAITRNGGS